MRCCICRSFITLLYILNYCTLYSFVVLYFLFIYFNNYFYLSSQPSANDFIQLITIKYLYLIPLFYSQDFWSEWQASAGMYCVGEVFNGDINYVAPYQVKESVCLFVWLFDFKKINNKWLITNYSKLNCTCIYMWINSTHLLVLL